MIKNNMNFKNNQRGAALISLITMVALILGMVQATIYYSSYNSSKLSNIEKIKIQAQQLAEAGIDMNISDIGINKTKLHKLLDTTTYDNKIIGNGTVTTKIKTISYSDTINIIDIYSTGVVSKVNRDIVVRMNIFKVFNDSNITTKLTTHSDTIIAYKIHTNNNSNKPLNNHTCNNVVEDKVSICHIPPGNPYNFHTITISSSAVDAHLDHGDVIGECSNTRNEKIDTIFIITNTIKLDSVIVCDTTEKVKIISWKE